MKDFFKRWVVNTVAVLVAANIVSGITYDHFGALLVASLLLGVLNAIVRPLMVLISLPLVVLTLGLFVLVINALLLRFIGWLVNGFNVSGFWAAFWGALIISIVSLIMNALTGTTKVRVQRGQAPNNPPRKDDGGGPVIDV